MLLIRIRGCWKKQQIVAGEERLLILGTYADLRQVFQEPGRVFSTQKKGRAEALPFFNLGQLLSI
jgi:hypothetical protein